LGKILEPIRKRMRTMALPAAARSEARRDHQGLPAADPGIEACVSAALDWLGEAQDHSASHDGGVARDYSLIKGWATSYPETTGYVIPTLVDCAAARNNAALRDRARRMLDWLVKIQLPDGAFQGGRIDSQPVVPVVFNTGQILLGLAAGAKALGEPYRDAMTRAADWLKAVQDPDGCWRKHGSPFAAAGEKTYDTHVAWGMMEAERVMPGRGYGDAALHNVRWAITHQRANGWFAHCCLEDAANPLTHTIGYVLRGVVEAYRLSGDEFFLKKASLTADALLEALAGDGFLPGRLDSNWRGAVSWSCLTGAVQIAHCWLMLSQMTGKTEYKHAAQRANAYVRRTMTITGPSQTRGGVKGSFPVDGGYGTFQYLNWACKFFIDANLLEQAVCARTAAAK